jgi:hypothetical protein
MERDDVTKLRIRIPPPDYYSDLRTPGGRYMSLHHISPICAEPPPPPPPPPLSLSSSHPQQSSQPQQYHQNETIYDLLLSDMNRSLDKYLENERDIGQLVYEVGSRCSFEIILPEEPVRHRRHSHHSSSRPPLHPLTRPPLQPNSSRPPRPPRPPRKIQSDPSISHFLPPLLDHIDRYAGNVGIMIQAEISEYLTTIIGTLCDYGVEISGNKADPYSSTVIYPSILTTSLLNRTIKECCTYMYHKSYYSQLYKQGVDLRNYNYNTSLSNEVYGVVVKNLRNITDIYFFRYDVPKTVTIQEASELVYRGFKIEPSRDKINIVSAHKHRGILFIKAHHI